MRSVAALLKATVREWGRKPYDRICEELPAVGQRVTKRQNLEVKERGQRTRGVCAIEVRLVEKAPEYAELVVSVQVEMPSEQGSDESRGFRVYADGRTTSIHP